MSRASFFRPSLVFTARRREEQAEARRAGEQAERFRRVMLPHMDAAYTLARYLTRDPAAAEDVVQEAFLHAYRGFDGWRGESARAWLLQIVRNAFLTWVVGERRHAALASDTDALPAGGEPADHRSPEAILAEQIDADMLRSTIEILPEPFRETLVLRELEEMTYKDIAAISGVPIGTVMSRLARARQMLAALLLPASETGREARS